MKFTFFFSYFPFFFYFTFSFCSFSYLDYLNRATTEVDMNLKELHSGDLTTCCRETWEGSFERVGVSDFVGALMLCVICFGVPSSPGCDVRLGVYLIASDVILWAFTFLSVCSIWRYKLVRWGIPDQTVALIPLLCFGQILPTVSFPFPASFLGLVQWSLASVVNPSVAHAFLFIPSHLCLFIPSLYRSSLSWCCLT